MTPPRRALVTGAAGAIGAAIARAMRAARPGVSLALLDRDAAAMASLAAELGGRHHARRRSAYDLDALPALIRGLEPLDALVNCAGVMRVRRVDLALGGRARSARGGSARAAAAPGISSVRGMVERGGGVIVNVASMAGKTPLKGCTYYGAAKAGLGMASEIARAELAPHGVRVVTVYPGPVRSALGGGGARTTAAAGSAGSRPSATRRAGAPDPRGDRARRAARGLPARV